MLQVPGNGFPPFNPVRFLNKPDGSTGEKRKSMIDETLRSTVGWFAGSRAVPGGMESPCTEYRIEHDSIGDKKVPADAYYGVQTLRAAENFRITGLSLHPELINSLIQIKKAAAITNREIGALAPDISEAIVKACDEILGGQFRTQFVVDPIQGGAGTSLNMNANEVIANRAIEWMGGKKGEYHLVHPNDHPHRRQNDHDPPADEASDPAAVPPSGAFKKSGRVRPCHQDGKNADAGRCSDPAWAGISRICGRD